MAIKRQYYPINEAAQQLGCKTADLVHLGAIGKLNVWGQFAAPVAVGACPLLNDGEPDFNAWHDMNVDTEFLGRTDIVLLPASYMREVEADWTEYGYGELGVKALPRPNMVLESADCNEALFIHPEAVCSVKRRLYSA